MDVTFTAWVALIAGLVALLAFDLVVLHRGTHQVSMADAAWSTGGFIAIGVAFGMVPRRRGVDARVAAAWILR